MWLLQDGFACCSEMDEINECIVKAMAAIPDEVERA
jgi:hypothetical protein